MTNLVVIYLHIIDDITSICKFINCHLADQYGENPTENSFPWDLMALVIKIPDLHKTKFLWMLQEMSAMW